MSRIRWGWTLPPLLAAIAALAIYLPRLMPGVGLWDTAEFQTIGSTLGIAHPTGYPAYSILLGIANLVFAPLGEPAYRANLLNPFVLQILMQQSRHASAACRQLTAALSNFVAFPLGLLLLLRLDGALTLAVCGVLIPGSLLLYRASLDVAAARSSELLHSDTVRSEERVRRKLATGSSTVSPEFPTFSLGDEQAGGASRHLREAQRRQQIVAQRGTLVSQ